MRELAEINAISQYLVDLLHEIASCLAVRAANIVSRGGASSRPLLLRALSLILASILCGSVTAHQLNLAVLAKEFIALLTFERLVWEVVAHDTLDLFHHLSLQLVLDLGHLDVELWNWLWPHDSLDRLIGYEKFIMDLIALGRMEGHTDLLSFVVLFLVGYVVEVLLSSLMVMVVNGHLPGLTLAWSHMMMVVSVLCVPVLIHYILYYN